MFIGVLLGVGALAVVLLGLYFDMRKHRHIDIKGLARRKKGYGCRMSKRERLGLKRGAIRLEERELADIMAREPTDWMPEVQVDEVRKSSTFGEAENPDIVSW